MTQSHSEIIRSIEFEQEYFLAGLTIINYFGTVLKNRVPESKAKIRIEQDNIKVTLVIETSEGEEERIEKFLNDYTLAVIGKKSLEEVTQTQEQLMELRQQLRLAYTQVEYQRDFLNYKNAEINRLNSLFSKSLEAEATTINVSYSSDEAEGKTQFSFTDFLGWAQNGQILFVFFSILTGIGAFIIYPQFYPSGLPSWTQYTQDLERSLQNQNNSEGEISATEVGVIIEKVTVKLESGSLVSPEVGLLAGSGVIISSQDNIYSVITTKHVSTNLRYIVTPDRKRHKIDIDSIERIPEVDLLVVQFQSNNSYETIKLGNSNNLQLLDSVYIAGFSQLNSLLVTSGEIAGIDDYSQGYGFSYVNPTFAGLSGGPILNAAGELVGIHGKTEISVQLSNNLSNNNLGLGIPINIYREWRSKNSFSSEL